MLFPRRWIAATTLAVSALLGLIVAAGSGNGAGYPLGLALFALSTGFFFRLVKHHFDGKSEDRLFDIFPSRPHNLWLLLVLLGMLALVALGLASTGGLLYSIGIAVFVVSCLMGFRVLKLAFDRS